MSKATDLEAARDKLYELQCAQFNLYDNNHPIRLAAEQACIDAHKRMLRRVDPTQEYSYPLARKKLLATGTDLLEKTLAPYWAQIEAEQKRLRDRQLVLEAELLELWKRL